MPARPSTLAQQAEGSRSATIALKEFWQRRRLLLLSAVLFAGTLLLYGPVVSHQFINLDDDQYVTRNPHVTAGLTAEGFRWAFHTFEMGNWHPLAWLSHMLDCSIFGLNPAGHHYSSVLLHALNAVLLFLLFARATGAVGCSFVVAALFAVHPLNVESVAWVAERKTLISTLFTFLTFGAYGSDELIETNLGEAYNAAGQAEEALRHFKIAKALDPHCYLALYNIGSYLVEHGRPAESIPEFQAAIQYSGSRQNTLFAHANLGEAYLLLGENAQAERAFAGALRLDPNSFVALLGRGQALLRMKRYSEAETEFARALLGRPQPELFYLLGVALEGEQRFDLALEAYTQALRLAPGMPPAQARLSELQKRTPPASGPAR